MAPNAERRREIVAALAYVRAEHRAALDLRHMEDLSYAEIAKVLSVPDGTAKGWVSRRRFHANWSSQGPQEHGKFSYQLILDNGAEEALIMPTADDAKVLRALIHDADTLYWDLDSEVIIFGKVA